MHLRPGQLKLWLPMIVCLVLLAATQTYARIQSPQHSQRGYEQVEEGEDDRGEAAGAIAAWLFGIANFPVVLSIALKTGRKFLPLNPDQKKFLEQINGRQKHYFMRLHYWLNPLAVAVAIFHFSSVESHATILPQLGLGMMMLLAILGLTMVLRLAPRPAKKYIYKLHTSPIPLMAAIVILLIGHAQIH